MYSKQESSQLKQEFWTVFGKYMSPVLSAEGEKINWINYKTGEKDIYFRMNADHKNAVISIELTHKDMDVQALYFQQFKLLEAALHKALGEEWIWLLHTKDEHRKTISRIDTQIENVSILKKEDWSQLISFFKPRIIALDEFWSTAKYAFEMIR